MKKKTDKWKIPSVVVTTSKGLTRAQAFAKTKKLVTDFRGFTYDPKTGRCVFT